MSAGWSWEVASGLGAIDRIGREWDDLAHRGRASPTCDALWTRATLAAFGSESGPLVVHALRHGKRLVAVVPLVDVRGLVPTWACLTEHTPHWAIALDESEPGVADAILDHLFETAVRIDVGALYENGALLGALEGAARRRGDRVSRSGTLGDAIFDIGASWEATRNAISKNLQRDAPRYLRQLERQGTVSFDVVTGGEHLARELEEAFHLETLGWKSQSGSPILAAPETTRFYTDLAHAASAAGRFALYTLRVDSKLVAFEYCLRAQRRLDVLKLSFDPAYAKQSPGTVLRYWFLQREAELGELDAYSLGRPHDASGWKLRWSTRVAPLVRIRLYRAGLRGGLAYYGGPRLRGYLKAQPRVLQAVEWARKLR